MKQFKKMLRVAGIVILIVLACFGVGLASGATVPVNRRRENGIEIRTELKEADENKSDYVVFEKLN